MEESTFEQSRKSIYMCIWTQMIIAPKVFLETSSIQSSITQRMEQMGTLRTTILTLAHFLLAGVYLLSIFGFNTDIDFSGNAATWWEQLALWVLFAIYLVFTFPLPLLAYVFPGALELFGENWIYVWLPLQLGISYVQVATIGKIRKKKEHSNLNRSAS